MLSAWDLSVKRPHARLFKIARILEQTLALHVQVHFVCIPPKVCIYLSITVMSIGTNLSKWDVLSFSTYKYVGMIALVAFGLIVRSTTAYYAALAYVSGALVFFLMRTLKLRIEPEVMQVHNQTIIPASG